MKTAEFDKLYLIQPEIYDRVLPYLNEVEKKELNDVNKKNRHFEENDRNDEAFKEKNEEQKNDYAEEINHGDEETNHDAEKLDDDDVIMDPPPENEEVNVGSPDIPVEKPEVDKPKILVKMVKKSNGDWSIKKEKKNILRNMR